MSIEDTRVDMATVDGIAPSLRDDASFEVEVTRSGGPTYRLETDARTHVPRIVGLAHGSGAAAFDEAFAVGAVNDEYAPLDVLIVRQAPLPEGVHLKVRVIGALVVGSIAWVIGVLGFEQHRSDPSDPDQLDARVRVELGAFVQAEADRRGLLGRPHWVNAEQGAVLCREARRRGQLVRNEQRRAATAPVAWQASSLALRRWRQPETEAYTAAEYDILRLPFRFQGYAREAFDPDERILLAIPRPSAKPGWREFLGVSAGKPEGVLVITDRQVVLLKEAAPPGLTLANWGYRARATANERIVSARARTEGKDAILDLTIGAEHGLELLPIKLPATASPAVEQAAELLARFRLTGGRALRRIPHVEPEGETGGQQATQLVIETEGDQALGLARTALPAGEESLRQAVAPAASGVQGVTGLILTRQHLAAADIDSGTARCLDLREISSLELLNGLMTAKLTFFVPKGRTVDTLTVYFSYTVGVHGFVELARAVRLLLDMPPAANRSTDAHGR